MKPSAIDTSRRELMGATAMTELLEQRAAISAVLRAIVSSPDELQPIFETILHYASRICRAELGSLILFKQDRYRMVARRGPGNVPADVELRGAALLALSR
jgi:hypothetical protein